MAHAFALGPAPTAPAACLRCCCMQRCGWGSCARLQNGIPQQPLGTSGAWLSCCSQRGFCVNLSGCSMKLRFSLALHHHCLHFLLLLHPFLVWAPVGWCVLTHPWPWKWFPLCFPSAAPGDGPAVGYCRVRTFCLTSRSHVTQHRWSLLSHEGPIPRTLMDKKPAGN